MEGGALAEKSPDAFVYALPTVKGVMRDTPGLEG